MASAMLTRHAGAGPCWPVAARRRSTLTAPLAPAGSSGQPAPAAELSLSAQRRGRLMLGAERAAAAAGNAAAWGPKANSATSCSSLALAEPKTVILQTSSQSAFTRALERGVSRFLFETSASGHARAEAWAALGRFEAFHLDAQGAISGPRGAPAGQLMTLGSAADVLEATAVLTAADAGQLVVMDACDWRVIPAENLVAARAEAGRGGVLLARVRTAADAGVMLAALEVGVAGVVLMSDDEAEVDALMEALAVSDGSGPSGSSSPGAALQLVAATITRVEPVGVADRVCVDVATLLRPGEGLLTGSFAGGLFCVHSECLQSAYISARAFRVNAGAVHAYVLAPRGRTAYLSELRAGSEVLVVDASTGGTRTAIVGRCKIERRPMLLIEAEVPGGSGQRHSVLLQNAETVRLVTPERPEEFQGRAGPESRCAGAQGIPRWSDERAVSVASLQPGDAVLMRVEAGPSAARHTGLLINETIIER